MKEKSKDEKSQPAYLVEEYEKLANLHAALTEFMDTPADIRDVDYNFKRQKLIYEMDKLWPNFERICKNLGISLEYNSSVKLQERTEANFAEAFAETRHTSECDATSKVTLDRTKSVISDWSKSGKPIINIFCQSNAEYMQKLKQVFDDVLVRLQDVFGKKATATEQLHKTASGEKTGTAGDNIQTTVKTAKAKVEPIRNIVFICYSHKDKRWLDDLQTYLTPHRDVQVSVWSDTKIEPGEKWFKEIQVALDSSKVAVLLVSPNFLASEFINKHELTPILKKAEKGDLKIIWIPVRACGYQKTPLKDFQAVIDVGKPLQTCRRRNVARRGSKFVKKLKRP